MCSTKAAKKELLGARAASRNKFRKFQLRHVAVTTMHGGFDCVGSVCREDCPGLGLAMNHSQQAHRHETRTPSTFHGPSIGRRRRARTRRRLVAEQSSADGRTPLARPPRLRARPPRSPGRVPLAPRPCASRISAAHDTPNGMRIRCSGRGAHVAARGRRKPPPWRRGWAQHRCRSCRRLRLIVFAECHPEAACRWSP